MIQQTNEWKPEEKDEILKHPKDYPQLSKDIQAGNKWKFENGEI